MVGSTKGEALRLNGGTVSGLEPILSDSSSRVMEESVFSIATRGGSCGGSRESGSESNLSMAAPMWSSISKMKAKKSSDRNG